MWQFSSPPRHAVTTIPCRKCQGPLTAKRTCHEAFLECPACGAKATISEYATAMDEALEAFLEAINCDRV